QYTSKKHFNRTDTSDARGVSDLIEFPERAPQKKKALRRNRRRSEVQGVRRVPQKEGGPEGPPEPSMPSPRATQSTYFACWDVHYRRSSIRNGRATRHHVDLYAAELRVRIVGRHALSGPFSGRVTGRRAAEAGPRSGGLIRALQREPDTARFEHRTGILSSGE